MRWTDLADKTLAVPDDARSLAIGARECDAHALWACLSDFDGYLILPQPAGATAAQRPVPVLVEVDPQATSAQRAAIASWIGKPGAYDVEEDFYTGVVSRGDLPALHAMPGVLGWRIGLPVVRDAAEGEAAPVAPIMPKGAMPSIDLPPLEGSPLIGIIDHGIAVAHAAFRNGRGGPLPRVLALWDQDPYRCSNGHWQAVADFGYGGELTGEMLAGLIDATDDDERRIYELIDYAPVQRTISHGTHVLDLAAGEPHPLTPPGLTSAQDHAHWSGPASAARIIAVQLPYRPQKDTSGSSLPVHALDAMHYIVARAGKRSVVINVSDGAYGGPHDGHSMLERAIDRFIDRHPGLVLVLAAGNAHEDRCHAKSPALDRGAQHEWRCHVLPGDRTLSFVEVWFDRELAVGDVSLQVCSPTGEPAVTAALGNGPHVLTDDAGRVVAAVIGRVRSPNAVRRSMFLLALAPTERVRSERGAAPHGLWTLTVRNERAAAPLHADAWIERDTPALNDPGPWRQSYVVDDPCNPLSVDGQRTLGNLAGAEKAVVVGGHYARGSDFSGCDPATSTPIARYSSRGAGRAGDVQGPDLTAPSDESPVSEGLRAAANRSGATVRLYGTSVAAPQVTRRIVNQLVAGPATLAPGKGTTTDQVRSQLVPQPAPDPTHNGIRGRVEPGAEPY